MIIGTEWMIDAYDCAADKLVDLSLVTALLDRIVSELELEVVGAPLSHVFPGPGGVTALYLLSESHLCCHTYPEHEFASFNLYCCGDRREWPWVAVLGDMFGARRVEVRRIVRGGKPGGEVLGERSR
jgi:S-adenosylmethionine decarboxylase